MAPSLGMYVWLLLLATAVLHAAEAATTWFEVDFYANIPTKYPNGYKNKFANLAKRIVKRRIGNRPYVEPGGDLPDTRRQLRADEAQDEEKTAAVVRPSSSGSRDDASSSGAIAHDGQGTLEDEEEELEVLQLQEQQRQQLRHARDLASSCPKKCKERSTYKICVRLGCTGSSRRRRLRGREEEQPMVVRMLAGELQSIQDSVNAELEEEARRYDGVELAVAFSRL